MNCYLHEIEAEIYYGSSLDEGPHVGKRHNLILTNPPFGSSGAGGCSRQSRFSIPNDEQRDELCTTRDINTQSGWSMWNDSSRWCVV